MKDNIDKNSKSKQLKPSHAKKVKENNKIISKNEVEFSELIEEKVKKIKKAKEEKKLEKNERIHEAKRVKAALRVIKERNKNQKKLTKLNSSKILNGSIISTQNYKPNIEENIIELSKVSKSYVIGEVETVVLNNIDLKIRKGQFNVILGPSGSGKTTLLNLISGLDKATSGDVFVVGNNLSLLKDSDLTKFRREHIGFIFQQYNLLTNLTAKENAEVGENLTKRKDSN